MISVIMPVYNQLPYVGDAIESILAQTHGDLEFIIIDDASTEPVWDLVQDYARWDHRIRPIRNSHNLGAGESLNVGLDQSRGNFIARQDADDRSHPERLANQVLAFTSGVGVVTCWAVPIDPDGNEIEASDYYERWTQIRSAEAASIIRGQERNAIIDGSMMWTRATFERIGYFDVSVGWLESYNYILRILRFFELAVVPQVRYFRRRGTSTNERTTDMALARTRARETPVIRRH